MEPPSDAFGSMIPSSVVASKDNMPDTHGQTLESGSKHAENGHSNTKDTVTGAVLLALDVTASLADGVPFLPGAVEALKTFVEAYKVR